VKESGLCLAESDKEWQREPKSKFNALEVRPVYHKTDDRIRSHVFLCTLAYYLQSCSGISSSGLNLYSPPTAPTKIDSGQCAT
jgi:hypothetical protein